MSPFPAFESGLRTGSSMAQRNSSFTSLVYQEKKPLSGHSLDTMIQSLVEWHSVLQRLEEERRSDIPQVYCRCIKAVNINHELKTVARGLTDASRLTERVASEAVNLQLDHLRHSGGEAEVLEQADALSGDRLHRAQQRRLLIHHGVALERVVVLRKDAPAACTHARPHSPPATPMRHPWE